MPRRPSPLRDPNKAQVMALDAELGLLAAVLQQALHDVRSRRPDLRQDALQFLQDEEALNWWADVLGLGDALSQQVQAVLRPDR